MAYSSFDNYLENKVMSSGPLELVALLYSGAIDAIAVARQKLLNGAITERSRKITQAWEILQELRRTLDHRHAPQLSARLDALYLYMQERVLEANALQTEAPLTEVHGYLTALHGAWCAIGKHPHEEVAHHESVSVAC
jgi:flagellar protein FliS